VLFHKGRGSLVPLLAQLRHLLPCFATQLLDPLLSPSAVFSRMHPGFSDPRKPPSRSAPPGPPSREGARQGWYLIPTELHTGPAHAGLQAGVCQLQILRFPSKIFLQASDVLLHLSNFLQGLQIKDMYHEGQPGIQTGKQPPGVPGFYCAGNGF